MLEYIEIGKPNRKILKKANIILITDEVIFTVERLEHVENRRMNVYNEVKSVLSKAIYEPDYIYKDWNNRENTLIFIKSITESSKICIVIKIAKLNDEKHSKNSIITMMKIGKKTFKKIYKNKSPNLLYERLDKYE